jgi:hypothetical protein
MTFSHIPRLGLLAVLGVAQVPFAHAADGLPKVPAELHVGLFAQEPAIRNPAAMAFDR